MIGTMNILAACGGPDSPVTQGRVQVERPLLRLRARRPELLHRGDAPPARAAHPPGVRHRRGRRRRPGLRRAQPEGHGHHAALLQRPRARTCETSHSALLGLPAVPGILGFDPRYQFIHEDDIVGVAASRGHQRAPGHPQRRAGRRPGAERDRVAARQAVRAAAAAVGDGPRRRGRRACVGVQDPAGGRAPAALRARSGQPQAQAVRATASASRRARPCRHLPPRCA